MGHATVVQTTDRPLLPFVSPITGTFSIKKEESDYNIITREELSQTGDPNKSNSPQLSYSQPIEIISMKRLLRVSVAWNETTPNPYLNSLIHRV